MSSSTMLRGPDMSSPRVPATAPARRVLPLRRRPSPPGDGATAPPAGRHGSRPGRRRRARGELLGGAAQQDEDGHRLVGVPLVEPALQVGPEIGRSAGPLDVGRCTSQLRRLNDGIPGPERADAWATGRSRDTGTRRSSEVSPRPPPSPRRARGAAAQRRVIVVARTRDGGREGRFPTVLGRPPRHGSPTVPLGASSTTTPAPLLPRRRRRLARAPRQGQHSGWAAVRVADSRDRRFIAPPGLLASPTGGKPSRRLQQLNKPSTVSPTRPTRPAATWPSSTELRRAAPSVQQVIGGSSNGANKKVLASIENAQQKVKEATAACSRRPARQPTVAGRLGMTPEDTAASRRRPPGGLPPRPRCPVSSAA